MFAAPGSESVGLGRSAEQIAVSLSYVINTMTHTFHQRLYKWVPANCWVNVVRIFTRNCYQVFTSLYSAGGDFVWEIEVILRVPVLPYASFSRKSITLLRESLAEHRHCFPY